MSSVGMMGIYPSGNLTFYMENIGKWPWKYPVFPGTMVMYVMFDSYVNAYQRVNASGFPKWGYSQIIPNVDIVLKPYGFGHPPDQETAKDTLQ